ncbi:MAG TPA: sigma-70 family RNA polymerase sigma factor [Terriglobales bacterium]|nr:sigma-70 family RNA polymerase sigma factor [Terriglobales bacterium]
MPEQVRAWFEHPLRARQPAPLSARDWIAQTLQRHFRLFYGIAHGYFRDPSQAEDMVQNAAVKALQNLQSLKDPGAAVEWLARITRNACIDTLRESRHAATDPPEVLEQLAVPASVEIYRQERQRFLLREINALPENLAMVVRLRFFEDCDVSEIADLLGLRRNTVEVRLHRALKKLAKCKSLKLFQRQSR